MPARYRRSGVLSLDLVGVVGVHGAQACPQGAGQGLTGNAGQAVALNHQLRRQFQQGAANPLLWKEGLEVAAIRHDQSSSYVWEGQLHGQFHGHFGFMSTN
jgi:hypothetical protein